MPLPNTQQVKQYAGYAGTAAATAVTILGLQAKGYDPQKIIVLFQSLGDLVNNLLVVAAVVGGIYASVRGGGQNSNASVVAQAQQIASDPSQLQSGAAQSALVAAVRSIADSPFVKVATEAKAAVIDAAASIPEVVGTINVTDPALSNATSSNQVRTAGGAVGMPR